MWIYDPHQRGMATSAGRLQSALVGGMDPCGRIAHGMPIAGATSLPRVQGRGGGVGLPVDALCQSLTFEVAQEDVADDAGCDPDLLPLEALR